ncbi:hypothetical protein MUK42_33342 [Musa troglodytarum]|uniref:Secreted protein n=1 Tax=Musa troglodytarum TaxID=320322 RepID=A0A9E7F963_9LILI|nr:hypothetical protein MUK42_33342 [Musa troglodytarum]
MRPSSICILRAVAVLLLHHHLLPGVEASVEKACRTRRMAAPKSTTTSAWRSSARTRGARWRTRSGWR